jgi:hypothetical protein
VFTENVSIGAILQFRTSLSKLDSPFPFSYTFGKADTRDHCIRSAQNLYLRLLSHTPDTTLHFNVLGLVALNPDSSLNQEKLKALIKVLRPGRNGRLSLIDFVKSVVRLVHFGSCVAFCSASQHCCTCMLGCGIQRDETAKSLCEKFPKDRSVI